jgi:DNA invertase Pin-like site-specific DNA recombinase
MTIIAIIYARTSLDCPISADDQIQRLESVAEERGWTVIKIFTDDPSSVRKGQDKRPGESALLDAIRSADVQKVLIYGVDRVGKFLNELVGFLETCRAADVAVYSHEQGIDTATSNGTTLLDLSAMMAFHLRQSRREKILRGQANARNLSVRFGRPPLPKTKVEKAKLGLVAGKGVREVARLSGISAASASRLKETMGSALAATIN